MQGLNWRPLFQFRALDDTIFLLLFYQFLVLQARVG